MSPPPETETGFARRWRLTHLPALLAPGLLVAATGVGAGDLITAARAGIRTGTDYLWAVVIDALLLFAGLGGYDLLKLLAR